MEQLVTMRRRIKAVETIKKITNAMRLISMSTHTRLRTKKENIENYKKTFEKLWFNVEYSFSSLIKSKKENHTDKNLIILVGSQKGLCGTFNTNLFKFLSTQIDFQENNDYIAIGKNSTEFLKSHDVNILNYYNNFNSNNFIYIANSITIRILNGTTKYNQIFIISNKSKSFFTQQPSKFELLPLQKPINNNKTEKITYIIEQSPEEINNTIEQLIISVTIQEKLFESLISEQAARFLLMDSATNNAENLLNTMKLEYNKLRQANITRELTELASSY